MTTRYPTTTEIDAMVAFLPTLYAENADLVVDWKGGPKDKNGVITVPYPVYTQVVQEFMAAASQECWTDFDYVRNYGGTMLQDEAAIRNATIDDLKSMLTSIVRGERFCDGHWAVMIQQGYVRRVLERVRTIRAEEKLKSARHAPP